jgi:RimJ/RimL family protein N-acetyltransferase
MAFSLPVLILFLIFILHTRLGPGDNHITAGLTLAGAGWALFFLVVGTPMALETMCVRVIVTPQGIAKESPWHRRRSMRWEEIVEVAYALGWGAFVFVGPRRQKISVPAGCTGILSLINAVRLHLEPGCYAGAEKVFNLLQNTGNRKEAYVSAPRSLPSELRAKQILSAPKDDHVTAVRTAVKSEEPQMTVQPIVTPRLDLIPATLELVLAEINDRGRLAKILGARVPDTWPPKFNDSNSQAFFLTRLAEEPGIVGWWSWYFLLRQPEGRVLIGNGGFKGRPDGQGIVEIGYSVLSEFHRKGYASEAAEGLIRWAFAHPEVTTVIAETFPSLPASVGLLEKLGFRLTGSGSEENSIRYALAREEWKKCPPRSQGLSS